MGIETLKHGGGYEKLPDNVEVVETSVGKFRLVYGNHTVLQKPSDLGPDPAAVILEMGYAEASDLNVASRPNKEQYGNIYSRLEKEGQPIFVVDSVGDEAPLSHFVGGMVDLVAAAVLLTKSMKDAIKGDTRRSFLKKLAGAGAGLYFAGDIVSKGLASQKVQGAMKVNETLYPQSAVYILTLRNLLAAEKMEKIYIQNKELFSGRELVAVWGGLHTGIADFLRMGHEERMKGLSWLLGLLPRPFTTDADLAKIIRYDYNNQEKVWGVTEEVDKEIYALASRKPAQ